MTLILAFADDQSSGDRLILCSILGTKNHSQKQFCWNANISIRQSLSLPLCNWSHNFDSGNIRVIMDARNGRKTLTFPLTSHPSEKGFLESFDLFMRFSPPTFVCSLIEELRGTSAVKIFCRSRRLSPLPFAKMII